MPDSFYYFIIACKQNDKDSVYSSYSTKIVQPYTEDYCKLHTNPRDVIEQPQLQAIIV